MKFNDKIFEKGAHKVSICDSGMRSKVKTGKIEVEVTETHPLIMLAATLPWLELYKIILPDLKKSTKKGFWWLGRKLKVRIHLAAFVLQFNGSPNRVWNQR